MRDCKTNCVNPKFRFRNIGLLLISSGVIANFISFSGKITIPKHELVYGTIKFGDNNISFFVLDYFENKN